MSLTSDPVSISAGGPTLTLDTPSNVPYAWAVVSNTSPALLQVQAAGQTSWLEPFSAMIYDVGTGHQGVSLTPQPGNGSGTVQATWYVDGEEPGGTWPISLTANAITSGFASLGTFSQPFGTPGGVKYTEIVVGPGGSGSLLAPGAPGPYQLWAVNMVAFGAPAITGSDVGVWLLGFGGLTAVAGDETTAEKPSSNILGGLVVDSLTFQNNCAGSVEATVLYTLASSPGGGPTVPPNQYLPLAGGTMTGPISNLLDRGSQVYNVKAFGPAGQGGDDLSVFNAVIGLINGSGGGDMLAPPGIYNLSGSLIPFTAPVNLRLGAAGDSQAHSATLLKFAAGKSGFRFAPGSEHSTMQGGYLHSASTVAGTDCGVIVKAQLVTLASVTCDGFGQDGFNWDSSDGSNNDGCLDFGLLSINNKRMGFYRNAGTDTNVHVSSGAEALANGAYGHWCNGAANKFIKPLGATNVSGDFFDNGNSNFYDHPYSEGGRNFDVGGACAFLIALCGAFGAPKFQAVGGGPVAAGPLQSSTILEVAPGGAVPAFLDHIGVVGPQSAAHPTNYSWGSGRFADGSFDLIDVTNALFLLSLDRATHTWTHRLPFQTLDKIGFFGTAPIAQRATPVTLADVIALLQAYGLSA